MRILFCLAALFALQAADAFAQPIVTRDPRAYMETLADAMGVSGMAPLRSLYVEINRGAPLNTNVEAALLSYERGLPSQQAAIARVAEDVMLADTLRSIYLYHYFGENYWVFTRVDFVRIADADWAVAYVAFSSEWNSITISTTPGFRPSQRN